MSFFVLRRRTIKQNDCAGAGSAETRFSSGLKILHRGAKTIAMVLVPLLLLVSMASSSDTNRDAVTAALNKGMQREFDAFTLALGRVGDNCVSGESYGHKIQPLLSLTRFHAAQKAGLVTITPDGPGFWKVELVDPKPGVLENLQKMKHEVIDGCDSIPLIFRVATKTVVDISKVQEITSEKSEVEFTWKWMLTPFGEKLVNNLTEQERRELNAYIHPPRDPVNPDPTFNFADLAASIAPKSEKKALKKAGDSWVLDE
jgi:hypothetical protein